MPRSAQPLAKKLARAFDHMDARREVYDNLPPEATDQEREQAWLRVSSARSYIRRIGGDPDRRPTFKRRPTPPEQMRERLAVARTRHTRFEQAWIYALRNIDFPSDWGEARDWKEALEATAPEWRAAFLGQPPVTPGMATIASGLMVAA